MKKLKESLKEAMTFIGKYGGEIITALMLVFPTINLALGNYLLAMNGYMFAIMMAIGIMFQNKYYNTRRAYLELWYTLEAWDKAAKHHGRELVVTFNEEGVISSSMDRVIPRVLPSEAVYGFAGWLTSRDEETVMSAHHDSAVIASIVNQYVKEQGFEEPRDDHYPKNIVRMGDKQPDGKVDVSEGSGKVAMHDITT